MPERAELLERPPAQTARDVGNQAGVKYGSRSRYHFGMFIRTQVIAVAIVCISLLIGCESKPQDGTASTEPTPAPTQPTVDLPQPKDYVEVCKERGIDRNKLPKVEMVVKGKGTIILEFAPDLATATCKQILEFVDAKFYDNDRIHRVEDWVVQWGDPQSKEDNWRERRLGAGSTGKDLPFEPNDIAMKRGVLAMASTGAKVGGDCQMFILKKDSEFLNGDYCAFGYVTSGMDIVDKIEIGDQITMKRRAK
jgi:cyclophilin family peptidyl-prolyl cis-trans isomerase